MTYETEGKTRHITVGRKIQGIVHPVGGSDPDKDLVITNTQYWMGPDITVATATKGKVAFGLVISTPQRRDLPDRLARTQVR